MDGVHWSLYTALRPTFSYFITPSVIEFIIDEGQDSWTTKPFSRRNHEKVKSSLVCCLLAPIHGCAHLDSRLDMRFREAHVNELMASREEFMLVLT